MKDEKYYQSLDKRTKEYKEWKNKTYTQTFSIPTGKENQKLDIPNEIVDELVSSIKPSKGLGDTIEKITTATGIKKVVKKIFGNDCGCNERKEKLNKIFPYRKQAQRCMTEQMYNDYKAYRERRTLNVWKEEDIDVIITAYAHVFALQYHKKDLCRSCSGSGQILREASKRLDVVFESYK